MLLEDKMGQKFIEIEKSFWDMVIIKLLEIFEKVFFVEW